MDPRVIDECRRRYWEGESLPALARECGLSIWGLEMVAGRGHWHEARQVIDALRAQLAAYQAEAQSP